MRGLAKIVGKTVTELQAIPFAERQKLLEALLGERLKKQQANPILFYQPASPEAKQIHLSTVEQILAVGGNRSSKTESALAEIVVQMTGIVPLSLEADYPRSKLRPPIRARLVV
ncbi:MAG: hypothetical protein AAB721_03115, partial [Patescibacteria group bacterium]